MLTDSVIKRQLGNILENTDFPELGEAIRGKVRDSYRRGDLRILVTSDRISAFDCIIGTIPFKGQVLNQIATFWFDKTSDIVANHVASVPDPNVMIVKECKQLALEFIVRGYITGVTKTSAWFNYQQGVRNFCGNPLPEGLKKDQKLAKPILTPTTKFEKHDRPVSRDQAISEGLIDADTFDKAAEICFKLYERGRDHAASRGLILVDTKYELGMLNGKLVVSDEIHTPDSSRYWFLDSYEKLFKAGSDQREIDKEYVRKWLVEQGFRGDGTPPSLPDEVRIEAARRYINAYEIITGRPFETVDAPIAARIRGALVKGGYCPKK